jgi:methylamine dehydrogenase accessory protein MauD
MERIWLVTYVLAWALAISFVPALLTLLATIGGIHLRSADEAHPLITDEGPEIGSPMPELCGDDLSHRPILIGGSRDRELVALFVSPECGPCENLLRGFRSAGLPLQLGPEYVVIMETSHAAVAAAVRRHRLPMSVIADPDALLRSELGVTTVPYALLIDEEGIVRMKGVVNNRSQLHGLLTRRGHFEGGLVWQTEPPSAGTSAE